MGACSERTSHLSRVCIQKILPTAHGDSIFELVPASHKVQHMVPWATLLGFLLVGQSLSSPTATMSVKGKPMTDPRNDAALEYAGARTLPFVVISALHARTPLPPNALSFVAQYISGLRALESKAKPAWCATCRKFRSVGRPCQANPPPDHFLDFFLLRNNSKLMIFLGLVGGRSHKHTSRACGARPPSSSACAALKPMDRSSTSRCRLPLEPRAAPFAGHHLWPHK